jgi:hypothetical protein
VAEERIGDPRCPETGLTVPECSCADCLEAMLREFSPELLTGEFKVTRLASDDPSQQRKAA